MWFSWRFSLWSPAVAVVSDSLNRHTDIFIILFWIKCFTILCILVKLSNFCCLGITNKNSSLDDDMDVARVIGLLRCLDRSVKWYRTLQLQMNFRACVLRWLPVHLGIKYKLCLLMHSATAQYCPSYISDLVQTIAASSRRQKLYVRPLTTYTVSPLLPRLGSSRSHLQVRLHGTFYTIWRSTHYKHYSF